MSKKKIAILGGGMAGLSAAYQLTKTAELRGLYEVTVYQMGWRLGGKAASGRDALGRNLEHGLHVWFGCYANTFRMLQEVYDTRVSTSGSALRRWEDAVAPQDYTPIGVLNGDRWSYLPIHWPSNDGVPGKGKLMPTWPEIVENLVGWISRVVSGTPTPPAEHAITAAGPPPLNVGLLQHFVFGFLPQEFHDRAMTLSTMSVPGVEHVAELAHLWSRALAIRKDMADARHLLEVLRLVVWVRDAHNRALQAELAVGSASHILRDVLDIFAAMLHSIVWDLALPNRALDVLDNEEFRSWLIRNGASPDIVANSPLTRVVYDTLFQYSDGDAGRPSYAAGAALGVIIRLICTYKGHMMYDIQTGMGEAVVAPVYDALLSAQVSFRFFRRVSKLELSPDGTQIQRIRLDRQADTKDGEYRPTFEAVGLTCWPAEPFWDQLKNGEAMRAAKVNFESHWCNCPPVAEEVLELGRDFDTVVLAISMGAYKPLNDEDSGMCASLIEKSPRFRAFVTNIGLVPSQAVQLWCRRTTEELGWTTGKAASVSGPEYLNIWADMSQVLAVESWTGTTKPLSLHYLTGTFSTLLYREPASRTGIPEQAANEVHDSAIGWLQNSAYCMWPRASDGVHFDWTVLTDPQNRIGLGRFEAQFWRANIDPTECCVQSAEGTTRYRLGPDESGFVNLILSGEATRHGFNTTTIEGAVMSGMAASRAICGQPTSIVGYDFLRTPFWEVVAEFAE